MTNTQPYEPRSIREAHLFVEMTPCPTCGHSERAQKGALSFQGNRVLKRHRWPCAMCNTERDFSFLYPENDTHLQVEGYGPPHQPSKLLDAGQFLAVSDRYAKMMPSTQQSLQEAILAMEEVLKFIPPDADAEPPPEALRSAESQRLLRELPGQMRRARLEARLNAYRGMLQGGSSPKPQAPPPASPTPEVQLPAGLEARLNEVRGMIQGGGASSSAPAPAPAAAQKQEKKKDAIPKPRIVLFIIGLILAFGLVFMSSELPIPYGTGRMKNTFIPKGAYLGYLIAALAGAALGAGLFSILRSSLKKRGFMPGIGVVVGLVAFAPAIFYVGEWRFDSEYFEAVRVNGDRHSYSAYLRRGHNARHRDEVLDRLLPKALIREAEDVPPDDYLAESSLKTLEEFASEHPDSAMVDEIHEAIPRIAFNRIQDKGIPALRGFIKAYPDSRQVSLAQKAIHEHFDKAFNDFSTQAATTHANLVPVVKELLDYLEKHETAHLEMRFRAPSTKILTGVTDVLQSLIREKTPGSKLTVAPIEPYFNEKSGTPRERAIAGSFESALGAVFPAEVLSLVHGSRLGDSEASDTFASPTLLVSYAVKPSKRIFSGKDNPNRAYVGIDVDFQIQILVPDVKSTLEMSFRVAPPKTFSVSYSESSGGPSDGAVYNAMASNAFANLQRELRDSFFKSDSQASKRFDSAFGQDKSGSKPLPSGARKPGTSASRARGKLKPANPIVTGSLDKRIIRKVINQHKREVKMCYERELAKDDTLQGKVEVKFIIASTGNVQTASVKGNTINGGPGKSVGTCLTKAIKHWRFPAPKGRGLVKVTYPFVFESAATKVAPQLAEATPPAATPPVSAPTTPPPPAKIPAQPNMTASIGGTCKEASIQKGLEKKVKRMRSCYDRQLISNPTLAGRVQLDWTVNDKGKVESHEIAAFSLNDEKVHTCLMRISKHLKFDVPSGGSCKVELVLDFALR